MYFYVLIPSLFLFIFSLFMPAQAQTGKFIEVKRASKIYEKLDPKSPVLALAMKGQMYELIYEGEAWYQVKVIDKSEVGKAQEKIGWLEKNDATMLDKPRATIFSLPVGTFSFVILLIIATIAGAIFLIFKQKTAEI